MKETRRGLAHLSAAAKNSFAGLLCAFRREAAFRQEIFLGVLHFILLAVLPVSWLERILLTAAWLLWLAVELLNSAVEEVVDLVSPGWNEFAKRAKDYASAAVCCAICIFAGGWIALAARIVVSR